MSTSEFFAFKVKKKLEERLKKLTYKIDKQKYLDRLDYEIEVISNMKYEGYFLVVQDFIAWAKSNDILVGDGRGSGAGSLVAFALGITNVDSIHYDLYFERFLNPARVSMPDFDIDFQHDKRDLVIDYVKAKYGEKKVAQICTFGTYKAKGAIRSAGRVLSLPIPSSDKLSKMYPKPVHGKEIKFKDALKISLELKAIYDTIGILESDVLHLAEKMEDRLATFGVHPSGVIISNTDLVDTVPLALSKTGQIITQWDMNNIDESGLIKFDFLGLKTLTQEALTIQLLKDSRGILVDLDAIPLDDKDTMLTLRRGDNIGLFQVEASSGIRDLLVKIRPDTIEDISALVAMYRPGPLESSKMEDYLKVRAGLEVATYHHPDLKPILENTGGWLVYQEQVLRIARDLAGYTLAEADLLRRAVGKKKEKEMAEQHEKFFSGMKTAGYSDKLAQTLWDEIDAFSAYGFNKSHAVAYALTTYKTAYLKTHYPVEFMAATLSVYSDNMDKTIIYIQECKRLGIPILQPDVNESLLSFNPKNTSIRFGLGTIKFVGNIAERIIEERKNGPYKDMFDFGIRLPEVNSKVLHALVDSGAFDFTKRNRSSLNVAAESLLTYRDDVKKYNTKVETYNRTMDKFLQREQDIQSGKLSEKGKKLAALKKPTLPEAISVPTYVDIPESSLLERQSREKELTGYFISGHPLSGLTHKNSDNISSLKDPDIDKPQYVHLLGIISSVKTKETKTSKKRMGHLQIEDLSGVIEGVMFPTVYEKYKNALIENVPVLISAKVQYTEILNEETLEEVIIPSLRIDSVDLLNEIEEKESDIILPLTFEAISALQQAIAKQKTQEQKARITFISSSLTMHLRDAIGIENESKFRSLIHKYI